MPLRSEQYIPSIYPVWFWHQPFSVAHFFPQVQIDNAVKYHQYSSAGLWRIPLHRQEWAGKNASRIPSDGALTVHYSSQGQFRGDARVRQAASEGGIIRGYMRTTDKLPRLSRSQVSGSKLWQQRGGGGQCLMNVICHFLRLLLSGTGISNAKIRLFRCMIWSAEIWKLNRLEILVIPVYRIEPQVSGWMKRVIDTICWIFMSWESASMNETQKHHFWWLLCLHHNRVWL